MQKASIYAVGLALVAVLGFSGNAHYAFADTDTATSTPAYPGGHRHAVLAGSIDSINHKGAWVLENNASVIGKISYVSASPKTAEETRVKSLYDSFMASWLAIAR